MIMIAIFIALLFLVPAAALATNSTIPPDDCDDEKCILEEDECMPFDPDKVRECARMFLLSADCDIEECISEATLASCWTMECVKEQLIQSCEANEKLEYIDCALLFP